MERTDKIEIRLLVLEELKNLIPDIFLAIEKYQGNSEKTKDAVLHVIANQVIDVESQRFNNASLAFEYKKKKTKI